MVSLHYTRHLIPADVATHRLFLVEGLLTLAIGIAAFFSMPGKCKLLQVFAGVLQADIRTSERCGNEDQVQTQRVRT